MKNIFRYFFMISCLFTTGTTLHAQWMQSNGPHGGEVLSFAVSNKNLFVGTFGGGVLFSTNNGTSWTAVNTGLTNTMVYALAVSSTNLFAGTTISGVFLSTNNGTSWTAVNTGLTNTLVYTLAISGTNLFAGTTSGVFLSTNNGTSWTAVNTGLTGMLNTDVQALVVSGTNLFAGIGDVLGGIFLSTNNGTSWTATSTGLTNKNILSLVVSGTNLFAGTCSSGVSQRPLTEMTSVEKLSTDLPMHFSLDQNYPNHFNPSTTISFNLLFKSFVSLKVYDALGREVSTILSEELSAGAYSKQWNAISFPSGIFFYRLNAGSFTETKKLVLLK